MVTNTLDPLPKIRTALTIPLIAVYLSQQLKPFQIAARTNQSRQWVSEYITKHYDSLLPLIDDKDTVDAMTSKHLARLAKHKLIDIIDTCKDFNKRDLIPLTAVSDRHTQQYRLLSDKSTDNVSIKSNLSNIKELNGQLEVLEGKLNAMD